MNDFQNNKWENFDWWVLKLGYFLKAKLIVGCGYKDINDSKQLVQCMLTLLLLSGAGYKVHALFSSQLVDTVDLSLHECNRTKSMPLTSPTSDSVFLPSSWFLCGLFSSSYFSHRTNDWRLQVASLAVFRSTEIYSLTKWSETHRHTPGSTSGFWQSRLSVSWSWFLRLRLHQPLYRKDA